MKPLLLPVVALFLGALAGETPARAEAIPAVTITNRAPAWPAGKPAAPEILPGRGLAQHDFFYAGEAKTRDMYIVRQGRIVWAYHDSTNQGEISDATLLANGNILFAHQFGVTLINPDRQALWNHAAAPGCEIHTARMIGTNHVLFIQNGPAPRLFVANLATGAMEKEFPLAAGSPDKTHGQFRHAELTAAGTVLVAHMDMGKVVEYDAEGRAVWSVAVPGVWSAKPLADGNILAVSGKKFIREINRAGATVWEFTPADAPDYRLSNLQLAARLPDGHILLNNWFNQWQGRPDPQNLPVQAMEITPDKQVVWALRAWTAPAALGPATTIQLLDGPAAPEAVHFGDIR